MLILRYGRMARDSSSSSSDRSRSRKRRSRTRSRSRDRSSSRRTRRRSGSERRRRSRSRTQEDRIARSPSRTLYEEGGAVTVEEVPKLIKQQQDFIVELLADHKQEVEARLQAKQRRFNSKPLEKQYDVNTEFKELTEKALSALKNDDKKRVKSVLKKLKKKIDTHQEDLVIADTSPNGWLAVARLRNRSELPDDLRKKLDRVDKDIWRSRNYGGPKKKPGKFQNQSAGSDVRTGRPQQKQSPEEMLYNASRQIRAGTCSHCKKENHFYRECPDFWTKVAESRAERAKGSTN